MKYLILIILLASCTKSQLLPSSEPITKTHKIVSNTLYKIGQCLYLVDPENEFKGNKKDAMRIEEITSTHYVYRWWVYGGGWAIDVNRLSHIKLERLTKPLEECPDAKR